MKNIHLIPTDKPSRLYQLKNDILRLDYKIDRGEANKHIYITSDEEIKEGDWYFITESISKCESKYEANDLTDICKKIILTTDQDLIKYGVQAIDDEFLQWFVKNPSCEEVDVKPMLSNNGRVFYGYKIIIPIDEPKQIKCYCGHTTMCDCSPIEEQKDIVLGYKTSLDAQMLDKIEPKQETLEEVADNCWVEGAWDNRDSFTDGFVEGAKWQQERSYSEAIDLFITEIKTEFKDDNWDYLEFIKERVIEQFKKK